MELLLTETLLPHKARNWEKIMILLEWTKLISQAAEVRLCAEKLKEELNYLPSQPFLENFVEYVLGTSSNEVKETKSKGPMNDATVQDITTVNTSALNLCFSYQSGDTVTSVCNNLKKSRHK